MAGERISDEELGKRLSAGRGYARESAAEFADRIGANRNDLREWERGNFGSPARFRATARKREEAVAKVQEATGLPMAFFRIDFKNLGLIETWEQAEDGPEPPDIPPTGTNPSAGR